MSTVLLDGGLSTALEQAGHRLDHPLWTARLLIEEPEAIVLAHLAFLRAGARVLVTSSYQASVAGFLAAGVTAERSEELVRTTTALAVEARRRFADECRTAAAEVLVAASVGPHGATLGDGAEYRSPLAGDEALALFHTSRLRLLTETEPDLLAIETISSAREALVILGALDGLPPVPAWLTFTCRDGATTWGGDAIEAAVAATVGSERVVAVGVNCTAPEHVPELLGRIASVTPLPLVAYPNAGQGWDGARKEWRGKPVPFGTGDVATWIALGARSIGGCCGVGPTAIAALAPLIAIHEHT